MRRRARPTDDRVEPDWERESMKYETAWVARVRLEAWRWRVVLGGIVLIVLLVLLDAPPAAVVVAFVSLFVASLVFGILIAASPCPRCGEWFPYASGRGFGFRITFGMQRFRVRDPRIQCSSCRLVRLPVSGHDRAVLDGAFDDPPDEG